MCVYIEQDLEVIISIDNILFMMNIYIYIYNIYFIYIYYYIFQTALN